MNLADVEYAILETSGKLSIFEKDNSDHNYPLPLIVDSKINESVLKAINKNEIWLRKELNKENIDLRNIFYGFYKDDQLFLIEKDKIK